MSLLPENFGRRIRQTRFNPLRSLTPQTLASALEAFDAGHVRAAALLWEQILDRDDVLANAAPKRCKAVSRRPWEVVPQDRQDETAMAHAETLNDFWRSIRVTNAADENQSGGLRLLVRQMMSGVFMQYAVHEIVWQPMGAKLKAQLRFVPLYFFENITGRLRFIGPEGAVTEGAPLTEGDWLITAADQALMKAASICYLFKRLSLQDWLNFSEKFGIPGIHGETSAAKDSPEWQAFVEALADFANDWVTATTSGAKINLIETKGTGDAPFSPMVDRMDSRLAGLCRGGDLGTVSGKNQDTGASLQGEESDLLVEDDCEFITEALENISRRVIAWTYGEGVEPMARLVIQPPKPRDTALDLKIDAFLSENGVQQAKADVMERYGRSTPEAGAELFGAAKPVTNPNDPKKPAEPNDPADPEEPAENDGGLVPTEDVLRTALARAVGVKPMWLAPIADLIRELEAKATDGISPEELAAFTEGAAARIPELFASLDIKALADELEAATGTAVINGVTAAFRAHPTVLPAAA